jgi:hypothetical protein
MLPLHQSPRAWRQNDHMQVQRRAPARRIPLVHVPRRLTILLATLAVGLLPTTAATASDSSATHAYLKASYTAYKTSIAQIRLVGANVDKLSRRFAGECPRIGVGSPQNEDAQELSYEAFGLLEGVAFHTDSRALQSYSRAVKPLRWSNRRITSAARSYLQSLHELMSLPTPDLCSDVRSWTAAGYKVVPTSTISFNRHVESIEGKPVSLRLLAPYESGSDRALATRVRHLEVQLEHLETLRGQDWWNLILETVGLNQ